MIELFDTLTLMLWYIVMMYYTMFEMYLGGHYDLENKSAILFMLLFVFWPITALYENTRGWYRILTGQQFFL